MNRLNDSVIPIGKFCCVVEDAEDKPNYICIRIKLMELSLKVSVESGHVIDTNCVLEIASNLDRECTVSDAVTVVAKESNNVVSGIIGGIVTIVFIIIALIAIVGAIALLLKLRKKRQIETSHLR